MTSRLLPCWHGAIACVRWAWQCQLRMRVVWLLAAAALPAAAWAQDHVSARAYWTDTSGSASFEEARQAVYTPYQGVLSKGFSPSAQWVRLTLDGVGSDGPDRLVLRIRPIFLDRVTLFDPADPAAPAGGRSTGDFTPPALAEYVSLHHGFVVPAQRAPRQVWLRLVTTSTQLLDVQALSLRDMQREDQTLLLQYSAFLAILLSFFIWVALAWLRDQDPVNGAFALRQLVLLLYTAAYLGYHRYLLGDLISPSALDLVYNWLVVATTGLSIVFEARLLSEYRLPRWGRGLLRVLLAISGLVVLLLITGFMRQALVLNSALSGASLILLLLVALGSRRPTSAGGRAATYHLPKSVLAIYYASAALVVVGAVLPGLGWLAGYRLALYAVLLYGLISGLFMSGLLLTRSRRLELLRQDEANSHFLSRQQLALETQRRQDQSQLLNMLMHELKTPLAVIDLALKDRPAEDKAQGYVTRAIDNMKSIIERCVQTDRFTDRAFTLKRERFDLVTQLRRWLADHKRGQDRWQLDLPESAAVETDLHCLQIITGNLVENALRYGDPQQPVRLALRQQPAADGRRGLSLRVINGAGTAGWPDAEKVFSKYYRSPAAQRQSGTGLGLFLSHNLARQLGGSLLYRPGPDSICFELWLPT